MSVPKLQNHSMSCFRQSAIFRLLVCLLEVEIMGHQILAAGEVLWDLLPKGKQLGGARPTSHFIVARWVPMRGW